MKTFKYLLPFSYFYFSRLRKIRDLAFHAYYEWLANLLILAIFTDRGIAPVLAKFLWAYLAFISIYEIGYILNDSFSALHEKSPIIWVSGLADRNAEISIWIIFRIIIFAMVTFHLNLEHNPKWTLFYATLVGTFALHNLSMRYEIRMLTFMSLATLRFFAPVFIFLKAEDLKLIVPAIIVNYVFYRTINYMSAKNLMNIPGRAGSGFKVRYYLAMGILSALISLLFESAIPLLINAYYLLFMTSFFIAGKLGFRVDLEGSKIQNAS